MGVCFTLRWAPTRGGPSSWSLAPLQGDPCTQFLVRGSKPPRLVAHGNGVPAEWLSNTVGLIFVVYQLLQRLNVIQYINISASSPQIPIIK
ncbi:hypothetical protein CAAN1_15S03070 [[Candida] anglica]|uniref:Uncharacterized protein n=1 Tax=[Candida] anglica TaxID=148631 RepID=A0ABP0EA04_9ASCO